MIDALDEDYGLEEHRKAVEAWQVKYDEAVAKYPDACGDCGGVGLLISTYDPSPAGVSLGSGWVHDVDLCPNCLEDGKCPHCAQKTIEEYEGDDGCYHYRCTACGWDEEKDVDPVLPPAPEW